MKGFPTQLSLKTAFKQGDIYETKLYDNQHLTKLFLTILLSSEIL